MPLVGSLLPVFWDIFVQSSRARRPRRMTSWPKTSVSNYKSVPCNMPEEWEPQFSPLSCPYNVYIILYYYLSGVPNFEMSSSLWFSSWIISFVPYFFILVSSVLSCMIYRQFVEGYILWLFLCNCFISSLPDPNIPTDTHSCFSVNFFQKNNFAMLM